MTESQDAPVISVVDALMKPWRQGDIANAQVFNHFADLRRPTTDASLELSERSYSAEKPEVRIGTEVESLVVLTQTCDLQRSAAKRPYVELSPLVRVDVATAKAAAAREMPRYAAIAAMGPGAVADLDRIMTVEKGWLSYVPRTPGWETDEEIRLFQAAVARRYQRFAFPDDFVTSVDKLRDRIVHRHGRENSAEGQLFGLVKEIRVKAAPHWSKSHIDVALIFILPGGTLPPVPEEVIDTPQQVETLNWLAARDRKAPEIAQRLIIEADLGSRAILWQRLGEAWAKMCRPVGCVQGVSAEVADAREYSVEDYWDSAQLDLDYLSEGTLGPSDSSIEPQAVAAEPSSKPSMLPRIFRGIRLRRGD